MSDKITKSVIKTAVDKMAKPPKRHHVPTVAQMLEVVNQTWYFLADGQDPLELAIEIVAGHLAFNMKVSDKSNAIKYIKAVCFLPDEAKIIDWD